MINIMKRIAKLEVNKDFEENVKRAFVSRHNVIVETIKINETSKEYKAYEDNDNPIVLLFTVHNNKVQDLILVDKS